jgi:hypothetical protein
MAWLGYGALSVFAAVCIMVASPTWAGDEQPFAEAQVLIQLNDTDGDLGFHARIDGEPWKRVIIEGPNEEILFDVRLRRALRRQGLTEFAFESAEPTFDELDPEVFFRRFPEGDYEIEGKGFGGVEYESTSYLSHLIPAAPDNLHVSGVPAPEDCDGVIPVATSPIVIAWDEVDSSHDELGRAGDVDIDSYEVAVEAETVDYTIDVEGDVTEVELATGAVPSGEEVKYQVLVREAEGNESSSESCFIAP